MITFSDYCIRTFGEKLYKLSLDAGMTCPNRDGTCGDRGCIFCSAGGSGDFAELLAPRGTPDAVTPASLDAAIERAKARVAGKYHGSRYIAYFQAYTNTYAPVETLRALFLSVIRREDIAALSIATRPDCLPPEVVALLDELNRIKPVIVELGMQTANEQTADFIRRGYPLSVYDSAMEALNARGLHTVTHVILGLPGETKEDMLNSVRHAVEMETAGIKLQLLHVLRGTDLAALYESGAFEVLSLDEYIDLLRDAVALLPPETVVHRLTGDGPKALLIAPAWSADKKRVLNRVRDALGDQ